MRNFGCGLAIVGLIALCAMIPFSLGNGSSEPGYTLGTAATIVALVAMAIGSLIYVANRPVSSVSSVRGAAYSGSSGLDENISRSGIVAVRVTSDGQIYHVSISGAAGHVTSSGDIYMAEMGHVGNVRSDGVVVRDGMGPVLTVHEDGRITEGGSIFATARPSMNRIHVGGGALALLIYAAAQ